MKVIYACDNLLWSLFYILPFFLWSLGILFHPLSSPWLRVNSRWGRFFGNCATPVCNSCRLGSCSCCYRTAERLSIYFCPAPASEHQLLPIFLTDWWTLRRLDRLMDKAYPQGLIFATPFYIPRPSWDRLPQFHPSRRTSQIRTVLTPG